MIDKTAIVDSKAKLDKNVRVGPYCWRVHVRRFADVLEDFLHRFFVHVATTIWAL